MYLERPPPPGPLRVREDVELDRRPNPRTQIEVEKRLRGDGTTQPRRPPGRQALDDKRAGADVPRDVPELFAVAEGEVLLLVLAAYLQIDSPGLGRPIRREFSSEVLLVLQFLRFKLHVQIGAEEPVVPRVGHASDRRLHVWFFEFDREPIRQGRVGDVPDEAELERSRERPPLIVVGRRLCGREPEALIDAGEAFEADELDGPLAAAAPGVLCRDEDVDFRLLPVADVVDERDLGPEVVEVAAVAVEEHPQRSRRRGLRPRVPGGGVEEAEDEGGSRDD